MSTGAEVFTTIHLIVILVLALLTIAGIAWGMRLRRARRASVKRRESHQSEAEGMSSRNSPAAVQDASAAILTPVAATPEPFPEVPATPLSSTSDDTLHRLSDEPVAAATPMDASFASEATDGETTVASGPADQPVTVLKGLGPKIAVRLGELGIVTVGDVAALDPSAAASLDTQLGPFAGRMARDRWVEQARLLTAGDRSGFEAVFGKL